MATNQVTPILPPGFKLEQPINIKLPPGFKLESGQAQPTETPVSTGPVPRTNPAQKDFQESGLEHTLMAPARFMSGGMEQLGRGLSGVSSPTGIDDFLWSLSDVARGAGTIASPFYAPALVRAAIAHPAATLGGLGVGAGVQQGAESAGDIVGLPGTGRAVGDVLGAGAGSMAGFGLPVAASAIREAQANPAVKKALIKFLPVFGKNIIELQEALAPKLTPFPAGKGTGTKYGGAAKPDLQVGTSIPRGKFTPPPAEPEITPFPPGKGTGTKYGGPSGSQPGMPSSGGGRVRRVIKSVEQEAQEKADASVPTPAKAKNVQSIEETTLHPDWEDMRASQGELNANELKAAVRKTDNAVKALKKAGFTKDTQVDIPDDQFLSIMKENIPSFRAPGKTGPRGRDMGKFRTHVTNSYEWGRK